VILVKNPSSEKQIDLTPLFITSIELTQKGEPGLKSIKKVIDDAIRLISTNRFEDQAVEDYAKELNYSLYEISDMFEAMENF
jgi:AraC-like DNA-binding protein